MGRIASKDWATPDNGSSRAPIHSPDPVRRVLAADDHEINRKFLSIILKQLGISGRIVADGHEAVLAAEDEAFDLLLLDYHMPGLSGIEAIRIIKSGAGPNASTYAVLVSADSMVVKTRVFEEAGFDDFMPKPFSPSMLADILKGRGRRCHVG